MLVRRWSLVVLAALIAVLPACSGDAELGSLPDAETLTAQSAKTAAGITSTHFGIDVAGTVPGFAVDKIDGDLTAEGGDVGAKGTAIITALGAAAEVSFVLADGTLYLDTGGGYQVIPASQAKVVYDFAAVLDPSRGVAALIRGIADAETVAAEEVNGTPSYKITGTAAREDIAGLIPGANSDADITLWVSQGDGNQPVKAALDFPGKSGTVTVTLSDINEPVTIVPPR